jgi:hypothetical protein
LVAADAAAQPSGEHEQFLGASGTLFRRLKLLAYRAGAAFPRGAFMRRGLIENAADGRGTGTATDVAFERAINRTYRQPTVNRVRTLADIMIRDAIARTDNHV